MTGQPERQDCRDILPGCLERFDSIQADLHEVKTDVKDIRRVLCDDPANSLVAQVNRQKAYWKLFAVMVALVSVACTVLGIVYAAM